MENNSLLPQFREGGKFEDHVVGNSDCPDCWYRNAQSCECGGVIHNQYENTTSTKDDIRIILVYCCDKCGSTDKP